MRIVLRLAALGIVLVTVVLWFFGGMNQGWTKTSVTEMHRDPVTDLEFPVTEKRFLPGLEFLAGGAALGLVLAGGGLLFPKK